ncbi:MAG: ATP-binding protein, partial [Pseudomonadota bacterium]
RGAPELIAQLLDKLVDNAVSFSPTRKPIVLGLENAPGEYRLVVRNEGPPLPKDMQSRLFDSMVSVRDGAARRDGEDGTDSPHLGLGLYLVRLIAQIHGATVEAADVKEPPGVRFTVRLPR